MPELTVASEAWPLAETFRISRGAKTETVVVVVTLRNAEAVGRGECVPYPRYGESIATVVTDIEKLRGDIERGMDRDALQAALPAGAARNALDCALWDLEAKQVGARVWELAGITAPKPVVTAKTISLDEPAKMAAAAARDAHLPLLKLKVSGEGDLERVRAVRQGAPDARLIVDANEGWRAGLLDSFLPTLKQLGVEMVEQPLPVADDDALAGYDAPIMLCADEACHTRADLARLEGRYGMVNIKLDKTGGLTEALALALEARDRGFALMVGCMISTSLAMAPAMLLGGIADIVDLDGPLLLAKDRAPGLVYEGALAKVPAASLWG